MDSTTSNTAHKVYIKYIKHGDNNINELRLSLHSVFWERYYGFGDQAYKYYIYLRIIFIYLKNLGLGFWQRKLVNIECFLKR